MAACGGGKDKGDKKEQENYDDALAPADRMNAIKDIFIKADENGDKLISKAEWCKCSQLKDGKKYDKDMAIKEFKLIDKSNSGDISLAELDLYIVEKQLEMVLKKFKTADKSGDRKLDAKEFKKFFKDEGMSQKAVKKLWKKCDRNKDGKVSYVEFRDFMEAEMADGALKKTFSDMFEEDPRKAEQAVRDLGAKNQAKKDAKNKKK